MHLHVTFFDINIPRMVSSEYKLTEIVCMYAGLKCVDVKICPILHNYFGFENASMVIECWLYVLFLA